jgi:hypothetical protein
MISRFILCWALCCGAALAQSGNPAITTGQYNSSRTGANTSELILSPSNVNVNQFGKLFSWAVDGDVYAQPLYVPGVTINGVTTNVVYVATMHNNVYAFDAEHPSTKPLWQANMGTYVSTVGTTNAQACPDKHTSNILGILSTPVIDQSSGTLYLVAANPVSNGYQHYLHALDITTGKDKTGSPVLLAPTVSGSGYDSVNGVVTLTPNSTVSQRTALLLANGSVYAGFGNCGQDADPFHGWVVAHSTTNLSTQTAVFNSTPNSGEGGIWQSGRGLVADSSGDVYLTTGNASDHAGWANTTTGTATGDAAQADYPMRFIQLNAAGTFLGSFPPANYTAMNTYDLDFSSSGPLLIPGTNLVVAGGKDGIMYVFNPSNLSKPVQSFQATGTTCPDNQVSGCDQIHDLAFWNSQLYVWGTWDVLRAYSFNSSTGTFNATPSSQTATALNSYSPAAVAVSANGTTSGTGIVWAITPDSTLHALNAANVATELWNSNTNSSRDALPSYPKFTEPTVANGRVYVATHSNQIAVYGLLQDFSLSAPASSATVLQNGSTTFTINVSAVSGFSDPVTFSISGLPTGATASFSPGSVNGSGSTKVTITASSSTPTGSYNLIINGTGDGLTSSASVTLSVTTADTTPPQWTCCTYTYNADGSYTMTFSGWDTQSGMKSIQTVQDVNATVSIPKFTVGTTQTINFSATEAGWSSYVEFELMDVAGNIAYADPVIVDVQRQPAGAPTSINVSGPQEGIVTVTNGTPGLKNIRLDLANGSQGNHVEIAGLQDGEVRVVNITKSIPSGGTTITLVAPGNPKNGHALLLFGNVPMTGSSAPLP